MTIADDPVEKATEALMAAVQETRDDLVGDTAAFILTGQKTGLGEGEGHYGDGNDCAMGGLSAVHYHVPEGWLPRDVATSLSELTLHVADSEGWPRAKLIGLLMDQLVQDSLLVGLPDSQQEASGQKEIEAGMKFMMAFAEEEPELIRLLSRFKDRYEPKTKN